MATDRYLYLIVTYMILIVTYMIFIVTYMILIVTYNFVPLRVRLLIASITVTIIAI